MQLIKLPLPVVISVKNYTVPYGLKKQLMKLLMLP